MIEDEFPRAGTPAAGSDGPKSGTATRRRKHIYPPADQVATEQAAEAARSSRKHSSNGAPPAQSATTPKRRKRIYPPADQMAADRAAAASRAASRAAPPSEVLTPVMAVGREEPVTEEAPVASVEEDGTSLAADRLDVRGSAVGRVEAGEISVAAGAIGAARADRVSVDRGALGAAMAGDVEISRGYARSIVARQVQIERGAARMIVAADVRADRTAVLILLARRVSGDVRVLLDWRGALAFGVVAGVLAGLISRLRRPQ
jgi:hypothetical protein